MQLAADSYLKTYKLWYEKDFIKTTATTGAKKTLSAKI